MNGWAEVWSDAIKIGVPALLAWATAVSIAKITRTQSELMERKRHAREQLQRFALMLASLHSAFGKHVMWLEDELLTRNEQDEVTAEMKLEVLRKLDHELAEMNGHRAVLTLLGFGEPATLSLAQYMGALASVREAFDDPQLTPELLEQRTEQLELIYEGFLEELGEAYQAL